MASLRLTVWLFSLSMILVFTGTLAQMDAGIWTVVAKYFRSFYVWIPLQTYMGFGRVFLGFPSNWQLPSWLGFPFPGGWTIGAALLINLLSAHLLRFRLRWNRAGILLTHTGIVLLLLGELITGLYQVEAHMTIYSGETVNYTDVSRQYEIAFTLSGNGKTNTEVTIPQSRLFNGSVISAPELPVDVEIVRYANNSKIGDVRPGATDAFTATDGNAYPIDFDHAEAAGVDASARDDIPSIEVRLRKKGRGDELGSGVFSMWYYPTIAKVFSLTFPPRSIDVDGKTWLVTFRPKRDYKPYSLQLLEFRHDIYIGTDTPKNYSSLVRLRDPEEHEDRTALISMNSPLRYRGDSIFQSGVLPGDAGTILQVVRNPGRLLPYIACTLVAIGLLLHFGQRLTGFLGRRMTK